MQTFVCPQCGRKSTYDPWMESAHCLDCGYTPSGTTDTLCVPERVSSTQELDYLISKLDRLPATTQIQGDPVTRIYNFTKEMVPNYIMLVRMDDYLYTFDSDARTVIAICGTDVQVDEDFKGVGPPTARIPFDERERYMYQVEEAGHRIGMAKDGILTCARCGHKNRTKDIFFPCYQCNQCGYVPPEREQLIQAFITRGIDAAKAGNLEEAQSTLKKALEHGGSADQQASALLWLAEVTPNLSAKQHYLKHALSLSPSEAIATLAQRKLAQVEAILEEPIELPPDTSPAQEPQPIAAERFVCPHCGGRMRYAPDGHALSCQYCGHRQPVGQARASGETVAEQPFLAAMATLKGHTRPVEARTFECSACGASFVLVPETLSLTCPYCGSVFAVEKTAFKALIPPGGLIPFTVSQTEAEEALRKWLKGAPSPEKVIPSTGLYLPVWTFDLKGVIGWSCDVWVGWSMARLSSYAWRRGEKPVSYDDILISASRKLPATLTKELLDFDLSQLVPYDPRYLADWPAGVYEIAMSDAAIQARGEAVERFKAVLAGEYGHIKDVHLRTASLKVEAFKLILLPVWIAHHTYQGRQYHAVINGQKGTVRAQKPKQKGWHL